jgi:hypothetical protein
MGSWNFILVFFPTHSPNSMEGDEYTHTCIYRAINRHMKMQRRERFLEDDDDEKKSPHL